MAGEIKRQTFCTCCGKKTQHKKRHSLIDKLWTGHPLRQGKNGLCGLTTIYTVDGLKVRGVSAEYRNIEGERIKKMFTFNLYHCKEEAIQKAEIWRLKNLRRYHNDCLTAINKGLWERG